MAGLIVVERAKNSLKNPQGITYSAKIIDRGSVAQLFPTK